MFLLHYTDIKNIESIKEFGLLSWARLVQREIKHHPLSDQFSREIDKSKKLEDYVRLYFPSDKPPPMMWKALYTRSKNITYIIVNEIVITWSDTLFSPENANSVNTIINNKPETALKSKDKQAEVLVKSHIPVEYLTFRE